MRILFLSVFSLTCSMHMDHVVVCRANVWHSWSSCDQKTNHSLNLLLLETDYERLTLLRFLNRWFHTVYVFVYNSISLCSCICENWIHMKFEETFHKWGISTSSMHNFGISRFRRKQRNNSFHISDDLMFVWMQDAHLYHNEWHLHGSSMNLMPDFIIDNLNYSNLFLQ